MDVAFAGAVPRIHELLDVGDVALEVASLAGEDAGVVLCIALDEELTAETRAVPQDEITTELLDVIIGFEALKEREKRKRTPGSTEHAP